ncbi:acetyl-coenzyme A synthetase N-terminal domain-containing protein, partial [Acinetobacter baumannii]
KSIEDPAAFWESIAEHFVWKQKWTSKEQVLNWDFKDPKIEWFKGAKLNITENCLDRHLAERGNQPAIIWEPNSPDEPHRIITYKKLHE